MLAKALPEEVIIKQLGLCAYQPIWEQMRDFTIQRSATDHDQLWVLEHEPIFTQGQAGKPEHVLNPGNIAIVQADRGGQVTYHGPGQLIVYFLTDLKRKKLNIREFVSVIENSIISLLQTYNIDAYADPKAPGVYVNGAKISSVGIRIKRGCSYHGLSLNVDMDLEPFTRINPCGYTNMQVVQLSALGGPRDINIVSQDLLAIICTKLGYKV